MANERPIIIIRKKAAHGGHHGGAWKVAYADFVTAMMALFIVLWLLNSSKQLQVAVGGYFKDPTGTSKKVGSNQAGSGENFTVTKENMSELKDMLQMAVRKMANFDKLKNQIEMTVTSEGLRVELMESEKGTFFPVGSSKPGDDGTEILSMLAKELGKLPNSISIEGHTDSKPYAENGTYSNWELSTDRANSARRVMQENGLGLKQVSQVRGYADQKLRKPDAPEDSSNRRISLLVQYTARPDADDDPKTEAEQKAAAEAIGKVMTDGHKTEEHKPEGQKPEGEKPGVEKPAAVTAPKAEGTKPAATALPAPPAAAPKPAGAKPPTTPAPKPSSR